MISWFRHGRQAQLGLVHMLGQGQLVLGHRQEQHGMLGQGHGILAPCGA